MDTLRTQAARQAQHRGILAEQQRAVRHGQVDEGLVVGVGAGEL